MDPSEKKFQRVYRWLLVYIEENKFSGNQKLPSENALCRKLQVSRETIRRAIDRLERRTPDFQRKFKSITTDNGSEFLQYDLLRKSCRRKGRRFDMYYCHSYSAWEKGCNENHNRMIRRFFPKGTNFDQITDRQIRRVQDWMNQYPRKSLAWKSPSEAA